MSNGLYEPVDASEFPRFSDVATFLRTKRADMSKDIDIGLVGVPFDLGLNFRGGPREAPGAVRQASRVIRRIHPTSGVQPYKLCNVADLGDAPVNPINLDKSVKQIEQFFVNMLSLGIRPISVGGDHTIPTPILRGLARAEPVGILQIDSHSDTLDELFGTKVNHATFMRRALEEGLIDPKRVVQIGLRGSRFSEDDIAFGYEAGFTVITFDEYEEMGRAKVIETIRDVLGTGRTYMTIDIDGLDPSFCPGTPVPEIGGLTPRDCQMIIRSIRGVDLVGADISEVAPCYDPTGITAVTAANLMFELLCVMAERVASNR
ncbi:agmatinase [Chelatococcus sp. GCM10030263]|uniref:agmatinase n=1 Tax=Chelatococcus sp. GCM10030263 TaxID=3273387 RepID=UPI00360F36DB